MTYLKQLSYDALAIGVFVAIWTIIFIITM